MTDPHKIANSLTEAQKRAIMAACEDSLADAQSIALCMSHREGCKVQDNPTLCSCGLTQLQRALTLDRNLVIPKPLAYMYSLPGTKVRAFYEERPPEHEILVDEGWVETALYPPNSSLLPVGAEVIYSYEGLCGRGKITSWIEGWYQLTFEDGSKAIVRPSRVFLENETD